LRLRDCFHCILVLVISPILLGFQNSAIIFFQIPFDFGLLVNDQSKQDLLIQLIFWFWPSTVVVVETM